MQSINSAQIMGNLGADPEIQKSANGKAWCRFSLATNYVRKNEAGEKESTATWHQVKVFGRTAELCQMYLKKGSMVLIDGYMQNRKYLKKDGSDGFAAEVIAQQVTFLSPPRLLPEVVSKSSVPF